MWRDVKKLEVFVSNHQINKNSLPKKNIHQLFGTIHIGLQEFSTLKISSTVIIGKIPEMSSSLISSPPTPTPFTYTALILSKIILTILFISNMLSVKWLHMWRSSFKLSFIDCTLFEVNIMAFVTVLSPDIIRFRKILPQKL